MSSTYTRGSRGIFDFPEDAVAQAWLDRLGDHQVYAPAQAVFEEELQAHVIVEGLLIEFNEDIHVAVGSLFAPQAGAEEADAPNAIALAEDMPFLFDRRKDLALKGHATSPCADHSPLSRDSMLP
jgi:hypothetical protein